MGRAHEVRAKAMAATAAAKSALYNRMSRDIYLAAKKGSTDPNANIALRTAIDKAKKAQVPSHVIENAIKKASGGSGEALIRNIYEGYGPGNSAIIVETLTDNVNRAFTEVRSVFTKCGGSIGTNGCVSYMFTKYAVVEFNGKSADEALEVLLEAGVDVIDASTDEEGYVKVLADPSALEAMEEALAAAGINEFETDEVKLIPSEELELNDEKLVKFERLLAMLDEVDDVQSVYHNVKLPESEEE
ncbi:MAG: YebC/PmpR family DNA-binding transcriptional regulator [Erysipelotrichaceae bacterium]|nr:YebC/PmpR family DNA-binding transcriptional regulator [Erysipelotrichaceae bacterium]